MSDKPDGGPAYPVEGRKNVYGEDLDRLHGMTLRDWFAGQALMGFLAYSPDFYVAKDPEDLAVRMYAAADAMIKERAK